MHHQRGGARIGDLPGKAFRDLHPPLDGGQQQHAAVRRQPPAIKRRSELLARDGW